MTYSYDLRQRALRAYDQKKGSLRQIADLFGVSLFAVQEWLQLRREKGDLHPQHLPRGPKPTIDEAGLAVVRRLWQDDTDATLAELVERYQQACGKAVSIMTMCRALQKLKLTRKKKIFTPRSGIHRR